MKCLNVLGCQAIKLSSLISLIGFAFNILRLCQQSASRNEHAIVVRDCQFCMATLEITTLVGCPLACTFCPQDALTAAYGSASERMLSIENFKLVLDKLPPHVRIDFSGMSEPFANPSCIDMVALAAAARNPIAIYTTLSGLTRAAVDYLVELIGARRFSVFCIHLPDGTGNMRGFSFSEDYLYALERLLPLDGVICMTMSAGAEIDSKLLNAVSASPRRQEMEKKLPRSAFKGIRRAGSLNAALVKDQPLSEPVKWKCAVACASTPFYDHNVLLPDGRVVLCCMDYGMKHVLGNLFKQDYIDLFSGNEIGVVQSSNMSLDPAVKQKSICTSCENVCTYEPSQGMWSGSGSNMSTKSLLKAAIHRALGRLRGAFL